MSHVVLVLGTKKGLFVLESDESRSSWSQTGPFLPGDEINHGMLDSRTGAIHATANNPWFGARVSTSKDMGANWTHSENGPKFPEGSEKTVARGWHVEPGPASSPQTLYCGVDPASLFRSDDGGVTWQEDIALNTHETRDRWFPGNGGLIIHSIVIDPANANRIWVAISAAGVFRTEDGGASWQPMNTGIRNILAKYDPKVEMYPEVGQCVHHLVPSGDNGQRLYAQGHLGTYRSDDGAQSWVDITEGLPSDFGLAMAAHPHNPDMAWVLPLQGGEMRCPPEGKLRIYKTSDAGKSWQPMTNGLPQEDAYMGIYREGMCSDKMERAGVYFGTNTGHLYASADEGESWTRITSDLPPVSSVSATVVE
jgi:hypothetical protein